MSVRKLVTVAGSGDKPGRVAGRGADGEMCPATDYHSKFLHMCYSGDVDAFNHPDDYNIDSLCDSIKIYHYLTVLQEKWMCAGTGKVNLLLYNIIVIF